LWLTLTPPRLEGWGYPYGEKYTKPSWCPLAMESGDKTTETIANCGVTPGFVRSV